MINIPHKVDRIIITEIPGENHSQIKEIILNRYAHTPRENINLTAVCMKHPDI